MPSSQQLWDWANVGGPGDRPPVEFRALTAYVDRIATSAQRDMHINLGTGRERKAKIFELATAMRQELRSDARPRGDVRGGANKVFQQFFKKWGQSAPADWRSRLTMTESAEFAMLEKKTPELEAAVAKKQAELDAISKQFTSFEITDAEDARITLVDKLDHALKMRDEAQSNAVRTGNVLSVSEKAKAAKQIKDLTKQLKAATAKAGLDTGPLSVPLADRPGLKTGDPGYEDLEAQFANAETQLGFAQDQLQAHAGTIKHFKGTVEKRLNPPRRKSDRELMLEWLMRNDPKFRGSGLQDWRTSEYSKWGSVDAIKRIRELVSPMRRTVLPEKGAPELKKQDL